MSNTLLAAQVILAEDDKDRGSPIGLFVVIVLCIAVYFLWKSLNRHIKRVPTSFGESPDFGDGAAFGAAAAPQRDSVLTDPASSDSAIGDSVPPSLSVDLARDAHVDLDAPPPAERR
ncbi:hypothetical protein BH10ACT8_BH10ACT8_06520 [soil metagenome]